MQNFRVVDNALLEAFSNRVASLEVGKRFSPESEQLSNTAGGRGIINQEPRNVIEKKGVQSRREHGGREEWK